MISFIRTVIDNAPTVVLATNLQPTCNNLQQRQGKWIIDKDGDYICNQCGNYPLRNDNEELTLSNFCPNCDAKMNAVNV